MDTFAKEHPEEFLEMKNALHEEMAALAFLANSNKHKYGHIIAELHDDYLKGNNHYPKNMNDMYKLLDEHSNDKKLIDPNGAGAPHLAFVQSSKGKFHGGKQLKCHKCGLPNYTVYTCPNCNNNRPNNGKHQSSNVGKHVKFQKGILKNKIKLLHRLVKVIKTKVLKRINIMVWDLCK